MVQEDNSKRDIEFELDVILETAYRHGISSSMVKGALRAIEFWDIVDQTETVEDIIQKIETLIFLCKDVIDRADIIDESIAIIIEGGKLSILDLYDYRNEAEIEIHKEQFILVSDKFKDTERRKEMLECIERNRSLIYMKKEKNDNKRT